MDRVIYFKYLIQSKQVDEKIVLLLFSNKNDVHFLHKDRFLEQIEI